MTAPRRPSVYSSTRGTQWVVSHACLQQVTPRCTTSSSATADGVLSHAGVCAIASSRSASSAAMNTTGNTAGAAASSRSQRARASCTLPAARATLTRTDRMPALAACAVRAALATARGCRQRGRERHATRRRMNASPRRRGGAGWAAATRPYWRHACPRGGALHETRPQRACAKSSELRSSSATSKCFWKSTARTQPPAASSTQEPTRTHRRRFRSVRTYGERRRRGTRGGPWRHWRYCSTKGGCEYVRSGRECRAGGERGRDGA